MTARLINTLLSAAAGACCAAAIGAVIVGVVMPVDVVTGDDARAADHRAMATTKPATGDSDALADAIASRTFRAPLADLPAGAAAPDAAATPAAGNALSLALVGTIGDSLALIRLADGSVVARGVGDDVAGGNVVAIGAGGVELSVNGQRIVLERPKPATSTGVTVERAS